MPMEAHIVMGFIAFVLDYAIVLGGRNRISENQESETSYLRTDQRSPALYPVIAVDTVTRRQRFAVLSRVGTAEQHVRTSRSYDCSDLLFLQTQD